MVCGCRYLQVSLSLSAATNDSRTSSENSEEINLHSCPSGSSLQPTTGTRHSDSSSASTDDSGISVSFEHSSGGGGQLLVHGGGPLGKFVPSESGGTGIIFPSVLPGASYVPGHQVSMPCKCIEPPPAAQLPMGVADNLGQKMSAATVTGSSCVPTMTVGVEVGRESPVFTSVSANGYSVVTPAISAHPKHHQPPQLGSQDWPTGVKLPPGVVGTSGGGGGSGKTGLLYGMFIKLPDGRWQCVRCNKLFNSQGSLRAHARIHTGERPYQCQYCYRTFCQASTLRSHERLHTGEKPYKCDHCGRAFTQSAGLRSHLKTHRYDS